LNKLANQDKHKRSLTVAGVNQQGPARLSRADGRPITLSGGTTIKTNQRLENNSIIMELPMPSNQPIDNFQISAMTYIAFDKNSAVPDAPVLDFLINMHDFIRDEVIDKFKQYFSQ
jgi:hypothetical protein